MDPILDHFEQQSSQKANTTVFKLLLLAGLFLINTVLLFLMVPPSDWMGAIMVFISFSLISFACFFLLHGVFLLAVLILLFILEKLRLHFIVKPMRKILGLVDLWVFYLLANMGLFIYLAFSILFSH